MTSGAGRPTDPVEPARLARASTTSDLPEGRLLVVRIDEVQNTAGALLSQLLTAVGDALDEATSERDAAGIERQRLLPMAFYLSGLPDFGTLAAAGRVRFRSDVVAAYLSGGWP